MDTELLVDERIRAGGDLVTQLLRDGFDVRVAFWGKSTDEGAWHLYVASPAFEAAKIGDAYREVYASLRRTQEAEVSLSDIKLIHSGSALAMAAAEIRDSLPGGQLATRYRGKNLQAWGIEEAYIYPRGRWFKGFDEIKRNFPSASIFAIPVLWKDMNFGAFGSLVGSINAGFFESSPPGTVMFIGPKGSSGKELGEFVFVHRPEGWNTLYRADTGKYEEVRHVNTNEPLYRSADFSPLAALKTDKRASDFGVDWMKERLGQGWRLFLPDCPVPIERIPFTVPPESRGELPVTIDWDYLRRFIEAGGKVEMRPAPEGSAVAPMA
jgi:hypothetical protein